MAASPPTLPPPYTALALANNPSNHPDAMATPTALSVKAVADSATCTCAVPKCRLVTSVVGARA